MSPRRPPEEFRERRQSEDWHLDTTRMRARVDRLPEPTWRNDVLDGLEKLQNTLTEVRDNGHQNEAALGHKASLQALNDLRVELEILKRDLKWAKWLAGLVGSAAGIIATSLMRHIA